MRRLRSSALFSALSGVDLKALNTARPRSLRVDRSEPALLTVDVSDSEVMGRFVGVESMALAGFINELVLMLRLLAAGVEA